MNFFRFPPNEHFNDCGIFCNFVVLLVISDKSSYILYRELNIFKLVADCFRDSRTEAIDSLPSQ